MVPLFGGERSSPARILGCAAALIGLPMLLVAVLSEIDLSSSNPFTDFSPTIRSFSPGEKEGGIWKVRRIVEWKPCRWWENGKPSAALPAISNGYIRVDCFGGLNQMRRDFCDGIGIARLLNATLVLPKFEAAAYWNESSGFADVFDVDYFIEKTKDLIHVVRDLPEEISSRDPFKVDCSKRSGQFDYTENVLPLLLVHRYISITPAMSQRRDRYPLYAKATLCEACYNALRLNQDLEEKAAKLLNRIPKPFLSLHLRFEPDMVAYSRCDYAGLTTASAAAISAARRGRGPLTGAPAAAWRARGKCPLTPKETAFVLQSLGIPATTPIYLAAGDGIMELEGLTSVYPHVHTKSTLLSGEDFDRMGGNTKAALDYYISINSDAYVATFFGNMDKMVAAMRAARRQVKTLFLNRRAFAAGGSLNSSELARAMWSAHSEDYAFGRGSALPDCFCEYKL